MPPRKTQTIKQVMKESKPIIDQKLGATRSKKIKKNDSDEDSDYVNTSCKQKKNNQSTKIRSTTTKQKESPLSDDPLDLLSLELKPFSQRQEARTKAEKMHDKHNLKADEVKAKQENENKNFDINQNKINKKDQELNQVNLNNKDKESSIDKQFNKLQQSQENEHKEYQNKKELSDKEDNKEQKQIQANNNTYQKSKDHEEQIKNNQQQNKSDLKVISQIINTSPESEVNKYQQRYQEEEEKEQQKKLLKVTVDIVFCCDINLMDCSSVDQLKNTIEYMIQQFKEKEKFSSNIKFSIVHFNDIITNEKLQQCQVIDLCDEADILQSLDEFKKMGQVGTKKGLYYGLKLATQTTKWRKESNKKSFRYIIHIANQQLQLDYQQQELEHIIEEMNNKNIRYKYLRINKKCDLDFDGKQYLQQKLNSYEESFLKEFGNLQNVVSGIILRELIHESTK